MTRLKQPPPSRPRTSQARPGRWQLQDAKARFSEVVRSAREQGPQIVTVHGRDEVVVVAADHYRRLSGNRSGAALVEAMQASPHRKLELAPKRARMPVRDVDL
ncbi:type II toxin-antitoxin system Phd/YefM family antitoxin [Rhodopseudomonas palustris]|uniref:type II toxin-antitoxin system Phd/YefM family antitoxin n=1 Tax=Rhodopseudomonas palustris TaxID=1076 RepID=UPI0020CD07CB|nr:type II toxin-antitoxin system Phd/YefM family antitoxin [Rhodopseudomonas palustris]MCP9627367.1 type II toxin-antitoxin system Phd/YefM family antitoxin [Rhodopseudomonas palustris]